MVAQAALVIWILISVGLFAGLPPLRAFLLTFVVGYLFLPVEIGDGNTFIGSIYLTQSLRIDKLTACNIGALLGTCIFASEKLRRFRFHWVDGVMVLIMLGTFLTSVANGLGAKDGVSHVIEFLRNVLPLIFLARIYLTGPAELHEALRVLIGGAFFYSILCIAEWRFSPQAHNIVYGYFQHTFLQFMRYSHFRPVGFLRHAIEASFFLGTCGALAGWLWHRKLLKPMWGFMPPWAITGVILAGTASTMTYSGFGACLACVAMLGLVTMTKSRWWLIVLPVLAIVWMGGRYSGVLDPTFLMNGIGQVDPDRVESLTYRVESERLHVEAVSDSLAFGRGAMLGVVKSENGRMVRALDAWWLITLVFYGLVGLIGWCVFWGAGIIQTLMYWPRLTRDTQTVVAAVCVMLGAQFMDFLFNSFPSPFLMILAMGTVATLQHYPQLVAQQRREMLWALHADGAGGWGAVTRERDGLSNGSGAQDQAISSPSPVAPGGGM